MNTSHPNILPLIAVKIKPDAGEFSMISEMMINGNVVDYIRENGVNRVRLVRPSVVVSTCRIADWRNSWRTLRKALNTCTNSISSMEI